MAFGMSPLKPQSVNSRMTIMPIAIGVARKNGRNLSPFLKVCLSISVPINGSLTPSQIRAMPNTIPMIFPSIYRTSVQNTKNHCIISAHERFWPNMPMAYFKASAFGTRPTCFSSFLLIISPLMIYQNPPSKSKRVSSFFMRLDQRLPSNSIYTTTMPLSKNGQIPIRLLIQLFPSFLNSSV